MELNVTPWGPLKGACLLKFTSNMTSACTPCKRILGMWIWAGARACVSAYIKTIPRDGGMVTLERVRGENCDDERVQYNIQYTRRERDKRMRMRQDYNITSLWKKMIILIIFVFSFAFSPATCGRPLYGLRLSHSIRSFASPPRTSTDAHRLDEPSLPSRPSRTPPHMIYISFANITAASACFFTPRNLPAPSQSVFWHILSALPQSLLVFSSSLKSRSARVHW